MMVNPYLTQRLKEERVKDALRNAEQDRLIRVAKGTGAADRAVLHSLLIKIRDLGLSLISAHRIEPDQDEVIGQPI
jgi:hypothetical protein